MKAQYNSKRKQINKIINNIKNKVTYGKSWIKFYYITIIIISTIIFSFNFEIYIDESIYSL